MEIKSFSQYQQLGLHQPLRSVMLEVHQCQHGIAHEMYTSGTCDNLVPPHDVLIFGPPRDASWNSEASTDRIFKKRATLLHRPADGYFFRGFQLLELTTVTIRDCGFFWRTAVCQGLGVK